jgi:uracil-DNA glycosylase
MGGYALQKIVHIDLSRHKIFQTVHPSPLSAHNGFFVCGVFKKIDDHLEERNIEPINW